MSLLQTLRDSSADLTPGEVPAPAELAAIVGALVTYVEDPKAAKAAAKQAEAEEAEAEADA